MNTDGSDSPTGNPEPEKEKSFVGRFMYKYWLKPLSDIATAIKQRKENQKDETKNDSGISNKSQPHETRANILSAIGNRIAIRGNWFSLWLMITNIVLAGGTFTYVLITRAALLETQSEFQSQHQAILQISMADTSHFHQTYSDITFQISNIGNETAKILKCEFGFYVGSSTNPQITEIEKIIIPEIDTFHVNKFIVKESPYSQTYFAHHIRRDLGISINADSNAILVVPPVRPTDNFIFYGNIFYLNQGTGEIQANVFRGKLIFDSKKSVYMLVNDIKKVEISENRYMVIP